MKCPGCGTEVDHGRWFCPGCDAPLYEDEDIFPESAEVSPTTMKEAGGATHRDVLREEGAEPGAGGDGESSGEGFMFRGRFRKSLVIRIIITVAILAILIAALLLISLTRKAGGTVILPAVESCVPGLTALAVCDRRDISENARLSFFPAGDLPVGYSRVVKGRCQDKA